MSAAAVLRMRTRPPAPSPPAASMTAATWVRACLPLQYRVASGGGSVRAAALRMREVEGWQHAAKELKGAGGIDGEGERQ